MTVDQNAVMLKLVCMLLAFISHPISLLMGICFKLPLKLTLFTISPEG